jgi:hypothetical protein
MKEELMPYARNGARIGAALLVFMLASTSSLPAQPPSAAQIVFLKFKMKNDTLALVQSAIRPGVLKQKRGGESRGEISYEVRSASGKLLWRGAIADPLLQRFEHEDPANPGRIKIKSVKLNEAEFTLRVPFQPEAHRIEFYRQRVAEAEQSRQKASRHVPLGSIILQLKGGEPK